MTGDCRSCDHKVVTKQRHKGKQVQKKKRVKEKEKVVKTMKSITEIEIPESEEGKRRKYKDERRRRKKGSALGNVRCRIRNDCYYRL